MNILKRPLHETLFRMRTYSGRWFGTKKVRTNAPLVICCVFKNEAPYLKEWIEYHLMIGVSRFYLINNHSDDEYREVLAPYLKSGQVQLFDTRTKHISVFIQSKELTRGLKKIRRKEGPHCWVSTLDIDEFLVSTDPDVSIRDVMEGQRDKPTAAILVNWLMFGTSGVEKLDAERPMLEQLTKCAPDDLQDHLLFKPLAYVGNVYRFVDGPHLPQKKKEAFYIYNDGQPFDPVNWTYRHSPLRVNHYWYRSEEYYYQKKIAKKKAFGVARNKEKAEAWHMDYCNKVEDKKILEMSRRYENSTSTN